MQENIMILPQPEYNTDWARYYEYLAEQEDLKYEDMEDIGND